MKGRNTKHHDSSNELSLAEWNESHIQQEHLQFDSKQLASLSAKCSFLYGNINGTGREGTPVEQTENSRASWEKQAISIITNYNVQHTDLGTIMATLSGRPLGSLDSLDEENILG